MPVFNIQCVGTHGKSYWYQLYTHFTLVSYLQEHPLYKNQAAKLPAILDRFLLGVDCIRQVPAWVGGRDQR